jgi:hypothetical protein
LICQFGEEGGLLYDRVRGRDPKSLLPIALPQPFIAGLEFEGAVTGSEALLLSIQEKMNELFLTLRLQ